MMQPLSPALLLLTGFLMARTWHLDVPQLERILEVSRRLARPFDLAEMLTEIVDAGREILDADRGSVFLFDPRAEELYTVVSTGVEGFRIPTSQGIVGECARTRAVINVPDAYEDPRFNRAVDKRTGYRTKCILSVPLVGHDDELVGVLQLLNKSGGCFDETDEHVAETLAAQCAVAIQRVQFTQNLVAKERLDRELSLARDVQMGFLPQAMPRFDGFDVAGLSEPADETGGDTFDLIKLSDDRLLVLLGDATGHGLAPALNVTQVRSMLRIASRLGADLDRMVAEINAQLVDDLAANRFVTAFLGIVDAVDHRAVFHAAGQGPIMHFHASTGEFDWLEASTLPLGLFKPPAPPSSRALVLEPGDILGLITDGLYERENADGEQFGTEGVARIVAESHGDGMAALRDQLMRAGREHAGGAPQDDDITIVLVQRQVE
jgi:phosphoserine phosphatase